MNMNWIMNTALDLNADGTYRAFSPEAWKYAGEMTLMGMAMIFAVLAILWAILGIFKLIFAGKTPKAIKVSKAPKEPKEQIEPKIKAEKKKQAAVPVKDDELSAVITAGIRAYQADTAQENAALVAILTAAVTAYREQEGESGSFRVVSFKRTGGAWNTKR